MLAFVLGGSMIRFNTATQPARVALSHDTAIVAPRYNLSRRNGLSGQNGYLCVGVQGKGSASGVTGSVPSIAHDQTYASASTSHWEMSGTWSKLALG